MRYDWLLEPISDQEPCGPDLDDLGDDNYLNYVLPVAGRIPERYYRADTDMPFERNTIKLKDEVAKIEELLKQTRDIRLLAIEARFQSFVGTLPAFADCIAAIAGLVDTFWDDVHPKPMDGDFTLRQNVLSGLDDWWQVIQPLQHQPLVRDKRLEVISFRSFAVASKSVQPRADEKPIELGEIHRSLASPENREASDQSYKAVVDTATALRAIRDAFVERSGYDYVPVFDKLNDFLSKVIELFHTARPELAAAAPPTAQETSGDASAEAEAGGQTSSAPVVHVVAEQPKGLIAGQADAAAALLAIEAYFAAFEPSSPALILVHQARTLVGKPLVYAFEALMPEAAARAVIKFQSGLDFKIPMPLMKALTDAASKTNGAAAQAEAVVNTHQPRTRREAVTLMGEVELFFKNAEPSSPIPMLLAKANGFTNRNFDMIVTDLIGPIA